MKKSNLKQEIKRLPSNVSYYQKLHPDNSVCHCCGLPWAACKPRSVNTKHNTGTFAVCEYCWNTKPLDIILVCFELCYEEQEYALSKMGLKMSHSLSHLLKCVQIEYKSTH